MEPLPDDLDPGIVPTVLWLRSHGFETTDSGDGSKADTMECAWPCPNVVIQVEPRDLISETNRLRNLVTGLGLAVKPMTEDMDPQHVEIQATYDPADEVAIILVLGLMLPPERLPS
jgi:hypothetical protein